MKMLCSIVWLICVSVVHLSAQSSFSAERLRKAVEQYVQKSLDDNSECVVSANIEAQTFTADNVTARCVANANSLRGSTNIAIEFVGDNAIVLRRIHVPVIIKKYATVPVAEENIRQSEKVLAENIRFERRDISAYKEEDMPTQEEISGAVARRNITKNSIITRALLLSAQSVKRGTSVKIYATVSGVTITSRGTALSDADMGQTVRVMRDGTQEALLCTVNGANQVQIQQ
ncbi:MAG: flagellar basal body P-ring formation chaperone FlgA [Candidatus Kapaibacterium sp.]|jgi:flagella basal body P-ring formation protein FlgA